MSKTDTKEKVLRAFLVTHKGGYIGGDALVLAETERKAVNAINKALKEAGIDDTKTISDLREVDLTKPSVEIISTGDY